MTHFHSRLRYKNVMLGIALILLPIFTGCGGSDSADTVDTATRTEKIVFVSADEGFEGINIINPDGTGRKLISPETGVGYTSSASFSPDGSKIAFLSNRDNCGGVGCGEGSEESPDYPAQIWLINTDGSGLRQLTRRKYGAESPMFSRDGSRILYRTREDNEYALHTMNLDGKKDTVLMRGNELRDMSLSPDGSKILFSGDHDDDDTTYNYDIYIMNVDGSNRTRLTSTPLHDSAPTFSRNGSRILFSRSDYDWSNPANGIYVMNADGTGQTQFTNRSIISPSFSPDDTKIVFSSYRESPWALSDTDARVFVMNADGSDLHSIPAKEGVAFFGYVSSHNAWGLTTAQ